MNTLRRHARVLARGTLPPLQTRTPDTKLPGFELEFHSGGRPFIVVVRARNSEAAKEEGLIEASANFPDFDHQDVRLVRCVEVH